MREFKYKKILLISVVIFLLLQITYRYTRFNSKRNQKEINLGNCFLEVERVSDPKDKERGLSNRDNICKDCGMLFYFDNPSKYGFWMKDMRFDLDMIWIKGDEVSEITRNVSHNSTDIIYPKENIDRVLELNAGRAEECNIKVGQKIK